MLKLPILVSNSGAVRGVLEDQVTERAASFQTRPPSHMQIHLWNRDSEYCSMEYSAYKHLLNPN